MRVPIAAGRRSRPSGAQKTTAGPCGPAVASRNRTTGFGSADRPDVLGPRSLGAAAFRVLDLLALVEVVVVRALQGRHVEEEVAPPSRVDEPETLVRQLLDRALRHL